MINIQKTNYHKDQHEIKLPLYYTDSDGDGLWFAMKLPKSEFKGISSDDLVAILNMVDRKGNNTKGNCVSYSTYEEFEARIIKREILEKDVLIQY